jgi:hypothetical protein
MTHDSGAAPNPFGGICSLVICKPKIREEAEEKDWVVGTGSKRFGFENKVIYAMEITTKMTLEEYDQHCKTNLLIKIPDEKSKTYEKLVGDCIYDFSASPPKIRGKIHNIENRPTDLGGKYALLSNRFYYFGNAPVDLDEDLLSIVKHSSGHISNSNDQYFEKFINWINQKVSNLNNVSNEPHLKSRFGVHCDFEKYCAIIDKEQDEMDKHQIDC